MSRSIFTKAVFTKARLKGAAGIAGLTAAGLVIATLPGIATSAEWVDNEWVSATQGTEPGVGTGTCEDPTFSTRGEATFLELDAVVLNDVLELGNLLATNDGTTSTSVPVTAPVGPNPPQSNQYFAPISVSALNSAIALGLPALSLPLNTDMSALASYAEAQPDGFSAAGSGLVTNQGAINLEEANDPNLEPLGSLSLDGIIDEVVPDTSPVADELASLDLDLGAVASITSLDACPVLWNEPLDEHLMRDYLIASMGLNVGSTLISDIFTLVNDLLLAIENIETTTDLDASLLADLTPILGGITSGLVSIEDLSVDATVNIDTTALASVLSTTYDGNGIVQLNLTDGTLVVDIAELMGGPNGLNDQPANTELLLNGAILDALEDAVLDALTDLVTQANAAIATVLGSITITGNITGHLVALGVDVADLTIPLGGGPVDIDLLTVDCVDPLNAVLCAALPVVTGVTIPIVEGLLTAALTDVVNVVDDAIADVTAAVTLVTDAAIAALDLLDAVDSLLIQLLGEVLGGLFGVDGLLSIVVNAQSAPTGNANPIPPNFDDPPVPAGQYDIAALRIGVLDLLGDDSNVDITFARSSVGENIYIP
jgi:hypothetical protein